MKGIDVSMHQGNVDWRKVRAAGYRFVVAKATEGVDYIDPTFTRDRLRAIRQAGLRVGAYHFARPDTGGTTADARAEARDFVAAVHKAGGRFISATAWRAGKSGVLGVLDFEQRPFSQRWAEAWGDEFRRRTGVKAAIYGGGYSLNPILGALDRFAFVWLAAYVRDWRPFFNGSDSRVWLWQYTSSGSVPGVSGRCDVNVWVGPDNPSEKKPKKEKSMARWHRNPAPHRRLNRGERGADVKRLQTALNHRAKERGWSDRTKVDGVFGTDTLVLYRKAAYWLGLPAESVKDTHPPTKAAQAVIRWPWTRTATQRRRAQARRPKRHRAGMVSENFHISEFHCHNGERVPDGIVHGPNGLRAHAQNVLEPMRAKHGPCVVNSGYRPRAYNASVGGASSSYHRYELRLKDPATDLVFAKGWPSRWAATADAVLRGDGGVGTYPTFVHVDGRPYRSRWSG